ncbi:unnamed protein product [Periconia digitata]|uniref:Uncharacterized protein n=1 Tax=Periconia digitata TaxID=1303443 RepID=A0A9W4ULR8_9PLEO|nr:unnamed protein product [Periconia digitata]
MGQRVYPSTLNLDRVGGGFDCQKQTDQPVNKAFGDSMQANASRDLPGSDTVASQLGPECESMSMDESDLGSSSNHNAYRLFEKYEEGTSVEEVVLQPALGLGISLDDNYCADVHINTSEFDYELFEASAQIAIRDVNAFIYSQARQEQPSFDQTGVEQAEHSGGHHQDTDDSMENDVDVSGSESPEPTPGAYLVSIVDGRTTIISHPPQPNDH